MELVAIDRDRRGRPVDAGLHLDALAHGSIQEVGHADDELGQVDQLGLEWLATRECEQLGGQNGGIFGGLDDRLGEALAAVVGEVVAAEDIRRALDHGKEVVEVVRNSAGQLAERLHLLTLTQLLFGLGALLDLFSQELVRLRQSLRALAQFVVRPPKCGLRHSQGDDDERRQHRQRTDDDIAGQPPRDGFTFDFVDDRSDRLLRARDRRCNPIVAVRSGLQEREVRAGPAVRCVVDRKDSPGAIVDADIADLRIDPECVDRLLARDGIAEIDGCSDRLGENLRRDQRLPVSSGAERAFVLKDDPQPGDENEDCDDENRRRRGAPVGQRLLLNAHF